MCVLLSMETPPGDAAGLGECCLGVEASGSWFVLSTAASDCRSGVPSGGFSPAGLAAVLLSTRFFSAATVFALVMLAAVAWLGIVSSSSIAPGGFPSLLGVRRRRRCSWRGVLLASCRSDRMFYTSGREAGSYPSSQVSISLADGAASSSQDERVGPSSASEEVGVVPSPPDVTDTILVLPSAAGCPWLSTVWLSWPLV